MNGNKTDQRLDGDAVSAEKAAAANHPEDARRQLANKILAAGLAHEDPLAGCVQVLSADLFLLAGGVMPALDTRETLSGPAAARAIEKYLSITRQFDRLLTQKRQLQQHPDR